MRSSLDSLKSPKVTQKQWLFVLQNLFDFLISSMISTMPWKPGPSLEFKSPRCTASSKFHSFQYLGQPTYWKKLERRLFWCLFCLGPYLYFEFHDSLSPSWPFPDSLTLNIWSIWIYGPNPGSTQPSFFFILLFWLLAEWHPTRSRNVLKWLAKNIRNN